jgi:hypothetical protein
MAYEKMVEEAETPDPDTDGNLVWRGFITKMYEDLGFHNPEFTYTSRLLQAMDCALQLKRGARARPSEWILIQSPTPANYLRVKDRYGAGQGNRTSPTQMVQQQNRDLAGRVRTLEQIMRNLIERVENLEDTDGDG